MRKTRLPAQGADTNLLASQLPSLKFPEPLKLCSDSWTRETDLSRASCLLAGGPHNNALVFLKSRGHCVGSYVCPAASPCSVTIFRDHEGTHVLWPPVRDSAAPGVCGPSPLILSGHLDCPCPEGGVSGSCFPTMGLQAPQATFTFDKRKCSWIRCLLGE